MGKDRLYISIAFAFIMYVSYIIKDLLNDMKLLDSILSLKNIVLTVICFVLFYFIIRAISSEKKNP